MDMPVTQTVAMTSHLDFLFAVSQLPRPWEEQHVVQRVKGNGGERDV